MFSFVFLVVMEDYEAVRCISRYTMKDDVRYTQYADYQDKWLSDSHPAFKASDTSVLSVPDLTSA